MSVAKPASPPSAAADAATASIDRIDALLPQTQCGGCGYPTCREYACAIVTEGVALNRCAPGGADGIAALAALLGRPVLPLDARFGTKQPPTVARIDEDACIGCTKCIAACPLDAIVGAAKRMHTVIADACSGCGLCLPPCPVDCIALVATGARPLPRDEVLDRAARFRRRWFAHVARLARPRRPRDHVPMAPSPTPATITREAVLAAVARGKAKWSRRRPPT